MKRFIQLACLAALTLMSVDSATAASAQERGKIRYQSLCMSCHSLEYNGVGPAHQGLFNRAAGRAPDYDYSPALKRSKVIWNEITLNQWLSNPERFIPGQKMGFLVASAQDRADLIAYLKQATSAK